MSNWDFIKIDMWWKAVFYLGVLSVIGSAVFEIGFIENKHLFGLGMGLILVGLGIWKSWKTFSQVGHGGIWKWKDYKNDVISVILILIGVLLIGLFGFLIIKGLI